MDDELGDQRVVVHGHVIAGRDAGVDAHARPFRLDEAQELAGGRQEAVGRVLGVQAALDGVPALAQVRLPERQGSPAAIRICHCTRSSPVTSSVIGCSTCRRVFISRKKNSRVSGSTMNSIVPALR